MKIITLTLNPAFDIHCFAESFCPFHENLARITDYEAGGKGVNISRALTVNGVENTALVVIGEENGDSFRRSLAADGMSLVEISVKGRIRENITLHTNNEPETRISFSGFDCDSSLLTRVERELDGLLEEDTVLTFTGRVPDGISVENVKQMLARIKQKGVKIVLDSRSFNKNDVLDCRPWLIKPNEEEIGMYTDIDVVDLQSAKKAAQMLRESGVENVMITLGAKGAVLCCADGCFAAVAPKINAISTIGAGDSSIAGFVAGAKAGLPYAEMLRMSVCYGSAACMTGGTRPPLTSDVERLWNEIAIKEI